MSSNTMSKPKMDDESLNGMQLKQFVASKYRFLSQTTADFWGPVDR